MKRTERGDNIIKFIEDYPGGVLSFNKIEKLAGVTAGRLSHYKHERPNCGLGPETLEKLEETLRTYGFMTDPIKDGARELLRRQKDGNFDISGIPPEVIKKLLKSGFIDDIGELTAEGKKFASQKKK